MDTNFVNPYDLGTATTFPHKAKIAVMEYYNAAAESSLDYVEKIDTDQVYVIWFCKTLQNWKAIVGSIIPDGRVYEVTYDGDKRQTYIDVYEKKDNLIVPD